MVVERAKKCLDFGFTLFLLHLFACWTYEVRTLPPLPHVGRLKTVDTAALGGGVLHPPTMLCTHTLDGQSFPSTGLWWLLHLAGVAIMVLLGASSCAFWGGVSCQRPRLLTAASD